MKTITKLKKEIEYWDDIEKQMDNCPRDNYKKYVKLEEQWINCNIDELKTKLQTLQEVCKEIQLAFNKCSSCMLDIVKEKPRDNNTQRDWEQRIDELILLYSSISGLNYNEAKKELLNKLEDDEK